MRVGQSDSAPKLVVQQVCVCCFLARIELNAAFGRNQKVPRIEL